MPRNGAGTYSVPPGTLAVPNATIASAPYNAFLADIATAITGSLARDGSGGMLAPLAMGGFAVTGVGGLSSAAEAAIASATTTDLLGAASLFAAISGTATITSLGTGANTFKIARFTGILTLTHNATSLILPGGANIVTAAGDTMAVISDGSSNARVVWYQRAAPGVANSGFTGQLFGLTLSNNVSDATNDIDVATGSARDSTDVDTLVLAGALTKRLDAAWAVGTNQGGLDTGSIANTTYHVWLIKRVDTGVVDALFSTSASAPTMPTNYTLKRRIGSIIRTGGAIVGFVQNDDIFMFKSPNGGFSALNPGTSAVTRTLPVPTGIVVLARIVACVDNSTSNPCFGYLSSLDQTDVAASATAYNFGSAGSTLVPSVLDIKTNTSAQIRSRLSASGAADTLAGNVLGYIDTRGRLS